MSAGPTGPQAQLAAAIPRRPRVGALSSVVLSLLFAALFAPIVLADRWLAPPIVVGQPAPITIRVPAFQGIQAPGVTIRGGGVVVARGEIVEGSQADAIAAARASVPHGAAPWFAYLAIALALTLLYTLHLRRNHHGRLLRVQLVHLGLVLVVALLTKIGLLLTPMSVLVIPVSLAAVVPTLVFDRTVGLATGVWASILLSFLVPFDVGVSAVMVVQAATAALLVPERHDRPWRLALAAGVVSSGAAALTYGAFHYLSSGSAPLHELAHPIRSAWAAAAAGGLIAAVGAVPLIPLYELMVGEITQGALIRHENMSHPLLKQIAEKSPGTWQHSLAMANMAEIAANAIGANGRLVRVGAYFHDLGKSLQPTYFIENLEPGQSSPHDRLPPEVSCDAIFAHVTEGMAVARRQKLPERIIDFMHMHHGDGVLEYFWAKCQEQGNPKHLPQAAFRYPGVPPQSRETAILAICDAVEAASRTLKKPDDKAVATLVQRIVYGKLHLGQLDESGLSMADLRKISDSLRETIKHAHHGRIEYPWQREAAEAEVNAETIAARPRAATSTGKFDEPRLDSLDAPRPHWGARPRRDSVGDSRGASSGDSGRSSGSSAAGSGNHHEDAIATTQRSGPITVPDPASSAPTLMAIPSLRATSGATAAAESARTGAMASTAALPTVTQTTQSLPVVVDREDGAPVELAPAPIVEPARELLRTGPIAVVEARAARPIAEIIDEVPEPLPAPVAVPMVAPIVADAPAAPIVADAPAAPIVADAPAAPIVADAPAAPIVAATSAARRPSTPPPPRKRAWTDGLAARVDAAIDDDEPAITIEPAPRGPNTAEIAALSAVFAGDEVTDVLAEPVAVAAPTADAPTGRVAPPPSTPPPPPAARRAHTDGAIEVEGDDIEAAIELAPMLNRPHTGPIIGPPPATRPTRPGATSATGDEPIVAARPPTSMLPPRSRTRGE
jgi:hypothetical protein